MSRSKIADDDEWTEVGEDGMDDGERAGEVRRCWESLCEAARLEMELMWRRSIMVAIVLVVVVVVVKEGDTERSPPQIRVDT